MSRSKSRKRLFAHLEQNRRILHARGKAANAGAAASAVSGLEQRQNAIRQDWSTSKVDAANLTAFKRVARAFDTYGVF